MNGLLYQALGELATWNERHHRNLHPEDPDGQPADVLGDQTFLILAGQLVLNHVLPFITVLCGLRQEQFTAEAEFWLRSAAQLVTTPADLSPDGSVPDHVLIARIRAGIMQQHEVLWRRGDAGNRTLNLDLLGQAVDKAELANQFGVALLHLGEETRAQPFFEAARDLAGAGSQHRANAESNLSNARRTSAGQWASAEMEAVLREQWRLRDFRNASVTAANLLRAAAAASEPVNESIVERALGHLDDIEAVTERLGRRSDLLGALSCYRASRGHHQEAVEVNGQIAELVGHSHPAPAHHLTELARWYAERGDHERAYRRALDDATRLARAGLPDPAAHSYIMAGHAAVSQYQRTGRQQSLRRFLHCSARLGRLLRSRSHLRAALQDYPDHIRDDTRSLRDQAASRCEHALALAAFHALREWEPDNPEPEWEMLSNAFHPRNVESVRALAASGALRRSATIVVDAIGRARTAVTTSRCDDPAAPGPRLVYGYLPLYQHAASDRVDDVARAGGSAVYELPNGGSVTVHEKPTAMIRISGDGRMLLQEVWGSKLIPYEVMLYLPDDHLPLIASYRRKAGPEPTVTVRWYAQQCRLKVTAGDAPWLGELVVLAAPAPPLLVEIFSGQDSPFAADHPFTDYLAVLRVLRSAADGSPVD